MKKLPALDALSTEELFAEGYAQLRQLKNRVRARRQREQALELVTSLHLTVNAISGRVAGLAFAEAPVMVEEEEDTTPPGGERISMAELLGHGGDDPDTEAGAAWDMEEGAVDVEELRQQIRALRHARLDYFRLFLAYFVKGCRHEFEVTKKIVAVVRRLSPHLLEQFGLSQVDVGRKFGESRAAVSIREKTKVERPLKAAGHRGILSNGARGLATSAACARAAKGNQNRRAKGRRGSDGHTPASQTNHTSETTSTASQ